MLVEHAHCRAAEVRTGGVAPVPEEPRVHDLEPPASYEHGATSATFLQATGGVAAHEGEVLQHQLGGGLVVAVRRRPGQLPVAGVLVDDATLACAAERDLAPAVEHDPAPRVVHHRGPPHRDGDGSWAAVERDQPAPAHGAHDLRGRAARSGSPTDDARGVGRVHRPRRGRHRRVATGIPSGRTAACRTAEPGSYPETAGGAGAVGSVRCGAAPPAGAADSPTDTTDTASQLVTAISTCIGRVSRALPPVPGLVPGTGDGSGTGDTRRGVSEGDRAGGAAGPSRPCPWRCGAARATRWIRLGHLEGRQVGARQAAQRARRRRQRRPGPRPPRPRPRRGQGRGRRPQRTPARPASPSRTSSTSFG